MDTPVEVISQRHNISFGKKSMSLIEVTKAEIEPSAEPNAITQAKPYAIWGSDNNRPQRVINENNADGTSAGAIRFKIWAHYGAGLIFYRSHRDEKTKKETIEIISNEEVYDMHPDIEEFDWNSDIENTQQGFVSDFEWFSHFYCQYIRNKSQNKIVKINWLRTKDGRPEIRNPKTGLIDRFYFSGDWPNPMKDKIAKIPALDRSNPFNQANAVYQHKLVSVDKDYFPTPYWESNLKWLEVAKKIPDWINGNIDNSMNIKYHIEIPERYFEDLYPEDRYKSQEECLAAREKAEKDLKTKIDDMLAGAKNASKTFYTKFATDDNGDIMPGWKINELKNDIKDGAWLNAYGTAAAAIATAHGVPPSLQGLILSNGLGTGSASDVREQFNYYLQLNTVIPRQTTLEPWNFVKRFNKWPRDLHRGYKNIILQTLDQNKSGFAQQNESNPTTQNK